MQNPQPDVALLRLELEARTKVGFPSSPGRALHGAVHHLLRQHDQMLAGAVHDAQEKPLTLSPLRHTASGHLVTQGCPAGSRVFTMLATLTPAVTSCLMDALEHRSSTTPLLYVGQGTWQINSWQRCAPPHTRIWRQTYLDLLGAPAAHDLELWFETPTTFRKAGDHLLHPGPHQVFGGYLRRWNALAGISLGIELADIDSGVALVDACVNPARADLGLAEHPGFTGWARYRVSGSDALASAIGTLAAFAPYCGTGARTAWGMGQTRSRILSAEESP